MSHSLSFTHSKIFSFALFSVIEMKSTERINFWLYLEIFSIETERALKNHIWAFELDFVYIEYHHVYVLFTSSYESFLLTLSYIHIFNLGLSFSPLRAPNLSLEELFHTRLVHALENDAVSHGVLLKIHNVQFLIPEDSFKTRRHSSLLPDIIMTRLLYASHCTLYSEPNNRGIL